MFKFHDIEEKYLKLGKGERHGNELLLDYNTAMEYLEELYREGYIILGNDFFIIKPDWKQLLITSLDLSDISHEVDAVKRSYEETKNFLKKGFPDNATHTTFVITKNE